MLNETLHNDQLPSEPSLQSNKHEYLKLQFTGTASEYFKIWITNLALTILTVGIYSAWAKVRRTKYFYNHTWLGQDNFDFTANPIKILKGRVIVVLWYGIFLLSQQISNIYINLGIFVIFIALIPWILIQARKFKLRNTTYLGLRFNYQATYREAFIAIYLNPLLSFITLFILKPYELRRRGDLLINNSSFANKHFFFESNKTRFGKLLLKSIGAGVIPLLLMVVLGFSEVFFGINIPGRGAIFFLAIANVYIVMGYFLFACRNEFINNTKFMDSMLLSTVSPSKLIWIYLSNTFAVACTVGLLYPWSKVRLHRYKIENLALYSNYSLASLRGSLQSDNATLAEEFDDFMDFDFGI